MRHKRLPHVTAAILLATLVAFFASSCAGPSGTGRTSHDAARTPAASGKPIVETGFLLGTVVSIKAYPTSDDDAGRSAAQTAVDAAMQRVREVEQAMSANIDTSDVSRANSEAGVRPVQVRPDTIGVIEKGLAYSRLTGGKFDISILPLARAWAIGTDHPRVPSKDEIMYLRRLVDYREVAVDQSSSTVTLRKPGMGIDLGAIAKGYAADEATEALRAHGVKNAIVNLGGNIVALGRRPDGNLWRIGIQNPRGDRTREAALVDVENMSVVTSGDYERYFERDGVRYHHILDPFTGEPARSGIMSATVIAGSSVDADALSTCVFLLGPAAGLKLIESLPGVECIIITDSRKVILSSGLRGKAQVTGEYELVKSR